MRGAYFLDTRDIIGRVCRRFEYLGQPFSELDMIMDPPVTIFPYRCILSIRAFNVTWLKHIRVSLIQRKKRPLNCPWVLDPGASGRSPTQERVNLNRKPEANFVIFQNGDFLPGLKGQCRCALLFCPTSRLGVHAEVSDTP